MTNRARVYHRLNKAKRLRAASSKPKSREPLQSIPTLVREFDEELESHDRKLQLDLHLVEDDPASIAEIADAELDVQLLAVDHDPHVLRLIHDPFPETRLLAVIRDPRTIQYISQPTNREVYIALSQDLTTYDLFEPTFVHFLIWLAIEHKVVWI